MARRKPKLSEFAKQFNDLANVNVQLNKSTKQYAAIELSNASELSCTSENIQPKIEENKNDLGITSFDSFDVMENKPIQYDDTCNLQDEVKKLYSEKSDLIDQLDSQIEQNKNLVEKAKKLEEENKELQFKISELSLQVATLKNELTNLQNSKNKINVQQQIPQPQYPSTFKKSLNGYSAWN